MSDVKRYQIGGRDIPASAAVFLPSEVVSSADYDALAAAHEQAWKSATSESHAWAREHEARLLVVAERDQLRAELEAIRGQRAVTKLQWPAIVDLVNEVLGCKAHQFPCERGSIGHEMTGINFNSLARIIDRVQHMCALPPQQPDAVSVPRELAEAVRELIGAANSVNRSRMHEVREHDDDQPRYWQRKEWVDWLVENGEKAQQALDALSTKNAEEV